MADQRTPSWFELTTEEVIDEGTLNRNRSHAPGPVGLEAPAKTYAYSVSGNPGTLMSGMFWSIAPKSLPGTWYDRSDAMNQFRKSEVDLGSSRYADPEFRSSAGRTAANLKAPPPVDVDIRVTKLGKVETMLIRGRRGKRSFRFDFDAVSKNKPPKGADPIQPFYDAIKQIVALVLQVR